MKILYSETVHKASCNYYTDIIKYLSKYNEVKLVVGKYNNLSDMVKKSNYNPDIIILGFTHLDCGDNNTPPKINNNVNIPCYIILNKEYTILDKKLNWIKNINPKKAFTVHHDYLKFQKITNIPFSRIMWSAETNVFKDYKEDYKYDFFFSGVIRKEQTSNWRNIIYQNLDKLKGYKLKINARFQNNNYKGKIFDNKAYAKLLACSKISLTTTGPADLVGTRYFEIMATNRSLIICNKMDNLKIYGDMLKDGFNCIMFSTIQEFIEKIKYYLSNEEERMKIVNNAYQDFLKNQTWDIRVKELIKKV